MESLRTLSLFGSTLMPVGVVCALVCAAQLAVADISNIQVFNLTSSSATVSSTTTHITDYFSRITM